jgi:diguanylate cyclase
VHETYLKTFRAGEIILKQGEDGRGAYIIEKGRVEIVLERETGPDQIIGTRGPGTMIGEMALIDDAPRTATVRALEECALLEITKTDFARRLEGADPVLRMTMQVIQARYRHMLARTDTLREDLDPAAAEAAEIRYAEQSDAAETIRIAHEFAAALSNNQLSLHYQPIVNLKDGHVDGFEALMRWTHPERGPISPAVFIPIVENNGMIVEASKWALAESLRALKIIETEAGDTDRLFMSVNFSSRDFAADDFVESLYNTLSTTDIAPARVHLEITERLLIGQPETARETLHMCRKAGLGISIDDFGTGYSSLSYLHYFPIDTLKIDRSFVKNMNVDPGALELVRSIIGLGKNLKMKIIAEGVENSEEAIMLRDMGCDLAQGYFFAKPMPQNETIAFLKTHHTIAF